MSKMIAVAFPILPNKLEQWKKFIQKINNEYKDEFINSRRSAGVRERTYLQQTPETNLVIVTLEGNDPASAFQKMMSNNDDFTSWFQTQGSEIHGIDLRHPHGPMPELVIDSSN